MSCGVLHGIAVYRSVLQHVAVCYSVLQLELVVYAEGVWIDDLVCVVARCSVLQCVAVCCSVSHRDAV